jgi:hypothetical protein
MVLAIKRRDGNAVSVVPGKPPSGRYVPYYVNPAEREQLAALVRRDGRADRFRTQLRRDDGTTFWTFSSARLAMYQGARRSSRHSTKWKSSLAASDPPAGRPEQCAHGTDRMAGGHAGRFDQRLQEILVTAARTLQSGASASGASPTTSGRSGASTCTLLDGDRHETGGARAISDAPPYFDALLRDRVIAAHDAQRIRARAR